MKLLLTICIFFIVNTGFSQFTSISQSITNTFQFAEINEANNVALIGGVYVAKSVDNGFTWSTLDLGGYQMPFLTYVYQEAVILNSTTYCLIGKDNVNSRANIIRTTDGGRRGQVYLRHLLAVIRLLRI